MNFLDKQKTFVVLDKSLQASALRHKVIANNIANINTPLFKRSEVSFENQLAEALAEEAPVDSKHKKELPLKTTNPKHFTNISAARPKLTLDEVVAQKVEIPDESMRNDQNNVDIDRETADIAKNSIYYNAVAARLSSYTSTLKQVIEGRK